MCLFEQLRELLLLLVLLVLALLALVLAGGAGDAAVAAAAAAGIWSSIRHSSLSAASALRLRLERGPRKRSLRCLRSNSNEDRSISSESSGVSGGCRVDDEDGAEGHEECSSGRRDREACAAGQQQQQTSGSRKPHNVEDACPQETHDGGAMEGKHKQHEEGWG
ncbi:hypothetical protein ACSSS7_003066 [Eimeria intestinalis]